MLYAIVAVIALILDQLLKYWTTINIVVNTGHRDLIPGFIHLTNIHNEGAAFSFLQGARWFFVALCVIFAVVVIYLLARNVINTPAARWMVVIVLAGALGNAIDRVINGYVVDMLEFDFKPFGMAFPVFNLADIYITLGAILFCVFLLLEKPRSSEKADAPKQRQPAAGPVPVPVQPAEDPAQQPQVQKPAQGPVVYTQPKPVTPPQIKTPGQSRGMTPPVAPIVSDEPTRPLTKTEQVMRVLVNGNAAVQPPQAPAVPPQPPAAPAPAAVPPQVPAPQPAAKPAADGDSFDLDDILAEFRDM